jgi:hypothetical protein
MLDMVKKKETTHKKPVRRNFKKPREKEKAKSAQVLSQYQKMEASFDDYFTRD